MPKPPADPVPPRAYRLDNTGLPIKRASWYRYAAAGIIPPLLHIGGKTLVPAATIDGIVGQVYGKGLRCPLCFKSGLRITLGDKPETLMAFCEACKAHGNRLVKAIWEATGVSCSPMPKRWRPSPEVGPEKAVTELRQSESYQALSARSKILVDFIADAVTDGGIPNGRIKCTGRQLMALLKTRSWKHLYKAVDAAIEAGIVVRGSRAQALGGTGGAANLWGLKCLPRWGEKRGG